MSTILADCQRDFQLVTSNSHDLGPSRASFPSIRYQFGTALSLLELFHLGLPVQMRLIMLCHTFRLLRRWAPKVFPGMQALFGGRNGSMQDGFGTRIGGHMYMSPYVLRWPEKATFIFSPNMLRYEAERCYIGISHE